MKLFGYLPETLFKPLSGPKKHVYARLLMRLYERVYSARILETPLREEVVKQIEIGLSEFGIGSMGDLSECTRIRPRARLTTSPTIDCAIPVGSRKRPRNGAPTST
jgi:hypothetical protein